MTSSTAEFRLSAARLPLAHTLCVGLDAARIPTGACVLLAVSGGADSMALLALCAGLADRGRVQPVVAHVDHGLRAESASEGEAVAALAARAGLGAVRLRVDLEPGSNLSARARRARYAVLADAARTAGAAWVLTAHHADDQLETMVLALARGTGLARMGGMRAVRGLAPGVRLVRPLLQATRADLRSVCRALHLPWCEDPGNADSSRPRGIVRHRIAPELDAAWPGCAARAARTATLLQWAADALDAQAAALESAARTEEGEFSRAVLRAAPLPVVAAFVRRSAGAECDGPVVWQVAEAIGDANTRPRRWRIARDCQARLTARSYSTVSVALRQRS